MSTYRQYIEAVDIPHDANCQNIVRSINMKRSIAFLILFCTLPLAAQDSAAHFDYRVLATTRTGTMSKEMNEAAAAGFVFGGVMGGQTEFGGKEVVVVL